MAFLAPAFLIGLLAALIPIAIHLIRRERPPKVVFGSIRFLKNTPKKLILFQQLQQWLLLLLRSLLIALLVFAFARPLLNQSLARFLDADPHSMVLVLDATMSMGVGRVFDSAMGRADDFVDALESGDEAAIVILDERPRVLSDFTADTASLRRALSAIDGASFGSASLSAGLALADELLSSARFENRSITLVSDFQASAAQSIDGSWKLSAGVSLETQDVGEDQTSNLSIVDMRVPSLVRQGVPAEPILTRIRSTGSLPLQSAQASLLVDGAVVERAEVALEGVAERVVEFAYDLNTLQQEVEHSVEVRVQGDSFDADNSRYALVAVEPARPVLVVNGEAAPDWFDDEAYWFALAAGAQGASPFEVEVVTANAFDVARLASVDAVVLLNVSRLEVTQARALERFVEGGGGVLVAPGDRALSRGSNLDGLLAGLLLGSPVLGSGDYRVIADFDRRHPLFADLPVEWDARFQRAWSLEPAPDASVLMRFDNAEPALLSRPLGAGRLLLTAMPLDSEWGNFPLQPAYLPFVHEMLTWLMAREDAVRSATVGDSILTATPQGELPGIRARVGGERIAINVAVPESELARRSDGALFDAVINPENTSLAPRETRTAQRMIELENPQRLWWWILSLALLLMLSETFISNRTYR